MEAVQDVRVTNVAIGGVEYAIVAVEDWIRGRWRLTQSEAELAAALLAGPSNAELARRRKRSINTVRNQLAALYKKLGVASRREAMVLLLGQRPE